MRTPHLQSRLLAERLNTICRLVVTKGQEGDSVRAGKILIAAGDFHMKVIAGNASPLSHLDQSPLRYSCRPAVDALFTSMSEVYGGAMLPVILTGMGQDGLHGSRILKAQGASVIAQDEASSAVWGMPGAVVSTGLVSQIIPLDRIAQAVLKRVGCARTCVCWALRSDFLSHCDDLLRCSNREPFTGAASLLHDPGGMAASRRRRDHERNRPVV
jgi:chemotaxis response regulator CheB